MSGSKTTPNRWNRRWRWTGAIATILIAIVAVYGLWTWRVLYVMALTKGKIPLPAQKSAVDRARLQAAMDEIRQAGDPLTTQEMIAYHRVPKGLPDLTKFWLLAISPIDIRSFSDETAELPVIGQHDRPMPQFDEPWPDRDAVEKCLQKYEATLSECQRLARLPGEVRYPLAFAAGEDMQLGHTQAARYAAHLLRLKFHVLLRERKLEAAYDCLLARFAVGKTLSREPVVVSWITQMAVRRGTLRDVAHVVSSAPLTESRLQDLQALVAGLPIEEDLTSAFIGDRAMFWHAMHHELRLREPVYQEFEPEEAGDDLDRIPRFRDCAAGLEIHTAAVAISRHGFPAALVEWRPWEQRLNDWGAENRKLPWPDYHGAFLFSAAFEHTLRIGAETVALRNIVAARIAIARYSALHGSPPTTLSELVPAFVVAAPIDPFDGQLLRYSVDDDNCVLYSIGKNSLDDGGVEMGDTFEPDIVCAFPLRMGPKPERAPATP